MKNMLDIASLESYPNFMMDEKEVLYGKNRVEILLEHILSKVELLSEGYDMLNQKIDRVAADLGQQITQLDHKIDRVDRKVDRMAADLQETNRKLDHVTDELAAHRTDTEMHPRYRVAER